MLRRKQKLLTSFALIALGFILLTSTRQDMRNEDRYRNAIPPMNPKTIRTQSHNGSQTKGEQNRFIYSRESLHHSFNLSGIVLGATGITNGVSVNLVTSLIYSFSPEMEKRAALRFVDPANQNVFYANSPAITWYNEELVLVIRIWLDRERYEKDKNWPVNQFSDNYFFTQRFNSQMEPLDPGHILGIPTPKQYTIGDGPIEPRIIRIGNKLLISFNAGIGFAQEKFVDWTLFWDYFDARPIVPRIKGGSPILDNLVPGAVPCDKHWMPFAVNDMLYFIHSLDPLRVMRCLPDNGECWFIHRDDKVKGMNHSVSDENLHFRGGTPMELYKWPYYVGFAHSTLFEEDWTRYYAAHLIVMSVEPLKIIYVSDPIEIHPYIYKVTPMVRQKYIRHGFIFPVGLVMESTDSLVIGVHVNDYSSILLRVRGIKAVIEGAIAASQATSSERGPPPLFIQKYLHDRMQNLTGLVFKH